MKQILKFEIPFVFYECFQLAIKGVNKHNNGKLIIENETKNDKKNGYTIEISTLNVLDFYYLGSKYAIFKETI